MKRIILSSLVSLLVVGNVAIAQMAPEVEYELCDQLNEIATKQASEAMCEEQKQYLIYDEGPQAAENFVCIKDGDFYEGLGIDATDLFDEMIKDYNSKNPSAKITCEDH